MSDVSHYDGLLYWGPYGSARVELILDLLELGEGSRVLDLGCGRAEFLLRVVERFGSSAVGVDHSEAAIAQATAEAKRRVPKANVELVAKDAGDVAGDSSAYDLVSWLGGPYLGENFESTVGRLSATLKSGGYLLVGHGFWQSDPPADYLEATGIEMGEFGEHWQNILVGQDAGLRLLFTGVANRDEWDEFEGRILCNWERRLSLAPGDTELQAVVERKRRFHDAQQRWGRAAMGFGLYLFRRPASRP